ncbi:MAG: hypothetical protein OWQ48_00860 [Desulfurococcus sp.]|nr:hypothetical protein [Desulfurococcus sp.]
MVKVTVSAEIRPTEDERKVVEALRNIFAGSIIVSELSEGYRIARGVSESIEALKPLRDLARIQQVEPALRSYLSKYRRSGVIELFIHKQAAYAGRLSLVDSDKESPLGAIRLLVEGGEEELDSVVYYLTGS